jgi:hypothetical protein
MAPNPIEQQLEQDDKAVLVYDAPGFFAPDSRVPRWAQNLLTDVFSFVILHYFVWGVPFLVLFCVLHKVGPNQLPPRLTNSLTCGAGFASPVWT